MITKSINKTNVSRKWWIIDASDANLGRISTIIADKLIGKNKSNYTPHVDNGDYVVVINSDKLVVSGNKMQSKPYYSHSGYPGNLKTTLLKDQITKDSTKVIIHSVKGMLPKNKLLDNRMKRLKVNTGAEHKNLAQQPTKIEVTK